MGNFQLLAEKVLSKQSKCTTRVSSFLSLRRETGNLAVMKGNFEGNLSSINFRNRQGNSGLAVETGKETNGKLGEGPLETFSTKKRDVSFLTANTISIMLDRFFDNIIRLKIELLHEDRRWIQDITFGIPLSRLKVFLSEYIENWLDAMKSELMPHRRQNTGRYRANSVFRESISLESRWKRGQR